ncbi:MAG TPA: YhjD/YihY/BrkB family envelope integrity protein [Trueperaceae bacterium]|nr:YhjD/YihY/BrkB family envelope integrity protein [Trueperaceae bacterium]
MAEVLRQPVLFGRRLVRRFQDARLQLLAAALAYYAAFSLGPLLLLLGGWLAILLRANPELAAQYRHALDDLLGQLLPLQQNTTGLVSHSFDTVLQELNQGALLRSALSFLVLVWASGNFFTSLQQALEVVFDVPHARGFLRKRMVAMLLVVAVALVIFFEVVGGALASGLNGVSIALADWLATFNVHLPGLPLGLQPGLALQASRLIVAVAAFTLTFRYLPREKSTWGGAVSGALVSAVGVLLARWALLLTFNAERFNLVYGFITSLVALLLWLYLALMLFLVGALVAAEASAWHREAGPPPVLSDSPG